MKNMRGFLLSWMVIPLSFFILFKINSLAQPEGKGELLKKFLHNDTLLSPEFEGTIKEIREAYRIKDFERIVNLHRHLPTLVQLSPEELLIIGESYFRVGEPEKALDLVERALSLRRGTELACEASLLRVKIFLILGREREAKKELFNLEENYCKESLGEKLLLLKNYLLKRGKPLDELLEAKLNYYLKKGLVKEAEREIFEYLNLTGNYNKGKEFFYKLAEAYYERKEILKAKKYYQLIITEWDPSKESFLSKFRLYQIAYERATIKELLPPKTIEDLLLYIALIKSKYPKEKIAEEASFLEIKIYYEKKDWERARERAKEFLKNMKSLTIILT